MDIKLVFRKGDNEIIVKRTVGMPTLVQYLRSKEYEENLMDERIEHIREAGYYLISIKDNDHEKEEKNIHIQGLKV